MDSFVMLVRVLTDFCFLNGKTLSKKRLILYVVLGNNRNWNYWAFHRLFSDSGDSFNRLLLLERDNTHEHPVNLFYGLGI